MRKIAIKLTFRPAAASNKEFGVKMKAWPPKLFF